MIIYIHGFGGSGASSKAVVLKKELQRHRFIAPSLSYVPDLAISTLKELIASYIENEKVYLIGSSLGGYYATYLANLFNIPAVLINPVVFPTDTLGKFIGQGTNYYDNSSYEWTKEHINDLNKFEILEVKTQLYFLLSQKGDELLDYREAIHKYKHSKLLLQENGSHKFDGIENHIEDILSFFQDH